VIAGATHGVCFATSDGIASVNGKYYTTAARICQGVSEKFF